MLLDGSTVWEAPKAIMRISDVLIRLIGARDPNCPNEADVLAYSEEKLSKRNRARVERHFAQCDDCRQVLAFLGRESEKAPLREQRPVVTQDLRQRERWTVGTRGARFRQEQHDVMPAADDRPHGVGSVSKRAFALLSADKNRL